MLNAMGIITVKKLRLFASIVDQLLPKNIGNRHVLPQAASNLNLSCIVAREWYNSAPLIL